MTNKRYAAAGALVFATAALVTAGCGNKAADTAVAPPTSQKGVAPVVPTGEVKGTPEQEAAKERGMAQGEAIRAANQPHTQ